MKNASFLEDRIFSIKISLAKSSGKLDMGWLGLEEIPPEVFDVTSLEVLLSFINLSKDLVISSLLIPVLWHLHAKVK